MKSAGKARNNGLYRHIRTSKEIIRNLLNDYFKNTAIVLTTDIHDIDQWQGGDIVIFENHIGIVSDKRNGKGIAFVLHNGNPYQRYYEEDILERRNDLVAHYRIS